MSRGWIEGLEARAAQLVEWLQGRSGARICGAFLAALLAVESVLLAAGARAKPFWYDELFTFYLASLRPFQALWEALRHGADPMTPVYLSLSWVAAGLPGDPLINFRLWSILGYLMALAGIYLLSSKRYGGLIGLLAALVVALSPFRSYGMEARPYALLAGLLAVAAASWQRTGQSRAAAAVFAVTMPLAATVHYYAVLGIGVMACAEGVYAAANRRARWRVWAVLGVSAALFAWMLPFARTARQVYGQTIWAKPDLSQFVRTYMTYLDLDINWAFAMMAVATLALPAWAAARWRAREQDGGFKPEEAWLALALLLYPAAGVASAMAAGAGYTPRYGWPAILGIALLAAFILGTINNRWLTLALAAALGLTFSAQVAKDLGKAKGLVAARNPGKRSTPAGLGRYLAQYPGLQLVVGDGMSYLEIYNSADSSLRNRMVQLTDRAEAMRLTGEATVDVANSKLSEYIGLRIEDRSRFLAVHKQFLLYGTGRNSEWVTRHLLEHGYHLMLLGGSAGASVYLASRPTDGGQETAPEAGNRQR